MNSDVTEPAGPPNLDALIARIRADALRPQYQRDVLSPLEPLALGNPPPAAPMSAAAGVSSVCAAAPDAAAQPVQSVDDLLLISDSARFVQSAYLALLGREPDAVGLRDQTRRLQEGWGQPFVLALLRASAEGKARGAVMPGWGLGPWVYDVWRVARRLGLGWAVKPLCQGYAAWRQWRLVLNGRLNSHITQTGAQLTTQLQSHLHGLQQAMQEAQAAVNTLRQQQHQLQQGLEAAQQGLQATQQDVQATQQDLQATQQDLQATQQDVQATQQDLQATQQDVQSMRGSVDAVAMQLKLGVDALQRELRVVQARTSVLVERQQRAPVAQESLPASAPPIPAAPSADAQALDDYYLAFEAAHRGSRAEIEARLAPYLPKLASVPGPVLALPMLDIGCGRGEWLGLLREQGFDARGIDVSAAMVAHCRGLGLQAEQADALKWLGQCPSASLGLVSAFHVVEHLPFEVLFALVAQVKRVLAPGGLLILETPNPENVLVGSHTFYHDFSHRNPVTPTSLTFLLAYHGLTDIEVLRLNPYPSGDCVAEPSLAAQRLNGHLYGPQDYGVVARA
ncbi:MAG: hypothetical protein OHK0048_24810 [Rhodoferax sp.]